MTNDNVTHQDPAQQSTPRARHRQLWSYPQWWLLAIVAIVSGSTHIPLKYWAKSARVPIGEVQWSELANGDHVPTWFAWMYWRVHEPDAAFGAVPECMSDFAFIQERQVHS